MKIGRSLVSFFYILNNSKRGYKFVFTVLLVKGQQAVVAKRGTLPATVTSEDNLLPVKKPRLSEENPPHNVVQMIKEASQQYGRQALREILDKFSQVKQNYLNFILIVSHYNQTFFM